MLELKDVNADVATESARYLQQKASNRNKAAFETAIFSALVFVSLACYLQFSVIRPFSSISSNFEMVFSKIFLLMLTLHSLLVYCQTFQLTKIFSVDYEHNLNLAKWQNLTAFFIWFGGNTLNSLIFSLAITEPVWMAYRSFSVLWLFSTLCSCVWTAFSTDFKLNVQNTSQFHQLSTLDQAKRSLAQILPKSVLVVGFAWPVSLVLAILFPYLRSTSLQLLAFWKVFDVLLLVFSQQLLAKYSVSCINYFMGYLTGRITQGFPANPTSFTKQTGLLAALLCEDPQLQLHGLYRLFLLSSQGPASRQQIYEVSLPGKHPRNWNYTKDICMHYIHTVQAKLESATRSKQIKLTNLSSPVNSDSPNSSTSSSPPNFLPEEKQIFFLPPNLKPRSKIMLHSAEEPAKKGPATNPFGAIQLPQFVTVYLQFFKATFFIQPFELQAAVFSIQTLGNAISYSIQEDEYGVVQKDLRSVISLLTSLSITIDAFVRSNEPGKMKVEPNIVELDNVLAETLTQINVTFGEHIKEINLHPIEEEVLNVLARSYLDPSVPSTSSINYSSSNSKKWK